MEEKKIMPEETGLSGGVCDKARAIFRQWKVEGLETADMFQRVVKMFDDDPQGAEEAFGVDFMDTIDYFTHYGF